jgi:ribosomal silencing factor RsfS
MDMDIQYKPSKNGASNVTARVERSIYNNMNPKSVSNVMVKANNGDTGEVVVHVMCAEARVLFFIKKLIHYIIA